MAKCHDFLQECLEQLTPPPFLNEWVDEQEFNEWLDSQEPDPNEQELPEDYRV